MPADKPVLPPNLVDKYLAQLSSRREELAQFLAHCEENKMQEGEREAARIHAHSLKGTGRTYGYPAISAAGEALEEAIGAAAAPSELIEPARALITACDLVLADRKPQAQPQVSDGEASPAKKALRAAEAKPKVLIVDDDPAIRNLLQQLLSRDAEILTTEDCRQALTIIERDQPDLVVLDDRMPGMTGLEMLERLRADGKQLPSQVVMLTANNQTPAIVAGMSAGAVDYVTKPFEPDRLINRIRNLLQRLRMTILVADDDAAVSGMLQHKFRMLGFRMLYAQDGQQAMRLMEEVRPQLAIIDRMMPGLDGLAVLQKIRAEENLRTTPVILLTAKRQNKDVVEGFHQGATDYIVKPFMPDEVVARAMRLLGLNEANRP